MNLRPHIQPDIRLRKDESFNAGERTREPGDLVKDKTSRVSVRTRLLRRDEGHSRTSRRPLEIVLDSMDVLQSMLNPAFDVERSKRRWRASSQQRSNSSLCDDIAMRCNRYT